MRNERILIVEDDAILALHLSDLLTGYGYQIEPPVATGEDAVARVQQDPPDLILMDIQLAGSMSGIEATEIIRRDMDIPVIYLTAYSDDQRLSKATTTQPYGYLIKPVQNRELKTTVEVALYKHNLDVKLKESEERFRAVIFQAADAIIILDPKTMRILEANPAFTSLFGYTNEEIPGLTLNDLVPEGPGGRDPRYAQIPFIQKYRLGEQQFQCKDNATVTVEVSSSLIPRGERDQLICLMAHDITERKRAENALALVNRKLNLLSSITRHDLINKLMVLIGNLTITQRRICDPAEREFIDRSIRTAESIRSYLEFTRAYQDLGVKAPAWQDVRGLMDQFQGQKIGITTDIHGLEIYADPMLETVFSNLYDNSLRHGGKVTGIRVSARKTGEGLVILWEDDGIGIPADQKGAIFQRGYGTNTGLGLYLAAEILAITGITIGESGIPGEGARFEVRVPKGMYRFREKD